MKFVLAVLLASALLAVTSLSCAHHGIEKTAAQPPVDSSPTTLESGRTLFLKNCAHCHGADAEGDEGPDLHQLDWTAEQITTRIRNGKKGQMTAFAGKLSPEQINEIVTYLITLK